MKTLISFSLFFMFAFSAFAQDGWHWQNPYFQGNDLNSIVMNGSVGWAVGDLGTVMHTNNSGFDWDVVDIGTSENLNCIYMAGVETEGWIVGSNGTIYFTDNAGATWSKQYSGTHEELTSVSAIEGACPWICGNDIILKTHNHGENWERVYSIFHSSFYSIGQKNCDEVWISGKSGLVISTKDEGLTWQSHTTPVNYNLYSIDIVANGDYRACGHQASIISSSDDGDTWIKENETTFLDLYDVDTRGIGGPAYAVGSKGTILETLNGGANWTQKDSPTINTLNDVCFQALTHDVYATGWYGLILRKEEPVEAKFEIMNDRPVHWMQSAEFVNADTGWVVGGDKVDLSGTKEGVILHTTDGGEHWEKQLTTPDIFNSVNFINENEGWAVGANGMIKHTINGGAKWTTQTSPLTGYLNSVHFVDQNNGWIVSSDNWGEIAHTTNGGTTWMKQTAPTRNPLYNVFFINVNKGWIAGMDSTLLRTTDGGQTWLRCDLVVTNNWLLRSVYFIDEMHGWTVGIYGIIMLTNDGGVTWQEIHTGFPETLTSVYFVDPKNGWATGFDGTILRSIDGGYTWFKQYSGVYRNILFSVNFINLYDGWICGEGGTVKGTKNGGFWNEPGTFLRNKLKLPINDLSETRDTLINDFSTKKMSDYRLIGLEVMIDSLIHSRAGDLEISLSHNGITETLVSEVTDPGSDFLWTRLTDDAKKTITDGVAPFSGNHKPYKPLTAFNGLDPGGRWILTIYDSKTGNTGTLNAWGIKPLFEKSITTGLPEVIEVKQKIHLSQNIPNPFSKITKINWISEISGFTTLKIFNVNGQEIAFLKNQFTPKGEYSVEFDGSRFSAGIYYYQLKVGDYMLTKKCVIM
jgi:photosystem II stability/assembly factor-like uncharacterized protein/subtilisin-like proprotein convertase family protein